MDRNFCLHFGAAVETLCLSVDMQEGGALGLAPGASEFLAIPCPHNGTAVYLCFMCNPLARLDT